MSDSTPWTTKLSELLRTNTDPAQRNALVDELFEPLTSRERLVLTLRFGIDQPEPRSLDETAQLLETNRLHVRTVEAAAMRKIRAAEHALGIASDTDRTDRGGGQSR